MAFLIYAITQIAKGIVVLAVGALIILYGFTMFGVITGSSVAQPLAEIMYGVTAVWIASVAALVLYHSYKKGDMSGKIPRVLGVFIFAVTVAGGLFPVYYSEFLMR